MKSKYKRGIDMVDKYMLLFISAMLLAAVFASAASASGINALSIGGDKQGTVGNFATVSIDVSGASDIGDMILDVIYDPSKLKANTVTAGNLVKASELQADTSTAGTAEITISNSTGINGNGPLAKINFSIVGAGTSDLNISVISITDINSVELTPNKTNGSTFVATAGPTGNDTIAPTTTISGVTEGGILNQNATITLTATDNLGGSGVNRTMYIVNGGNNTTYTSPFVVSKEGPNNIKYWSVDNAKNVESMKSTNFTINRSMPPSMGPNITNFNVSPSTGINSANPATSSADVSGNLKHVLFAIIDSNKLISGLGNTGTAMVNMFVDMSKVNGLYKSLAWDATAMQVTDGNNISYVTPIYVAGNTDIFVPGMFKKNNTDSEKKVVARFNSIGLNLVEIRLGDCLCITGPLVEISDGISQIKFGRIEGDKMPNLTVTNEIYTLFNTTGNNATNNPVLESIDVPEGTYTAIVRAEDMANNTNVQTMSIGVGNVTPPPISTGPFTVTPQSIMAGPGEAVQYTLTLNNTGNMTDTFNLTVSSPSNISVTLDRNNVSVGAGMSATLKLMANSSVIGTYIVNVTAMSANTNKNFVVSTKTNVVIARLENFTVGSGQKGGTIMVNSQIRSFDMTKGHWFVVVVSGTNPVRGYPLVGTGTIHISGNTTKAEIVPILVTIPPSADIGSYNLLAGLYRFDDKILSTPNLIGDLIGPQVATVS